VNGDSIKVQMTIYGWVRGEHPYGPDARSVPRPDTRSSADECTCDRATLRRDRGSSPRKRRRSECFDLAARPVIHAVGWDSMGGHKPVTYSPPRPARPLTLRSGPWALHGDPEEIRDLSSLSVARTHPSGHGLKSRAGHLAVPYLCPSRPCGAAYTSPDLRKGRGQTLAPQGGSAGSNPVGGTTFPLHKRRSEPLLSGRRVPGWRVRACRLCRAVAPARSGSRYHP
jgi:hypothetical protein